MSRRLDVSSIRIVNYIVRNQRTSYSEISENLDISISGIKNHILHINDILAERNLETIEVKQGLGVAYKGKISDLKMLIDQQHQTESRPSERAIEILRKLLQTDEYSKIQDISDEMYLSRTTVENTLLTIREDMLPPELKYVSNRNGIKIVGSEYTKRKELTNLLRYYLVGLSAVINDENYQLDIQIDENSKVIVDQKLFDNVSTVINTFIKDTNLSITDYKYQSLIIHIAIAIERIKNGFCINKNSLGIKVFDKETLILISMIEQEFGIPLPEFEKEYLSIHVSAIKTNTHNSSNLINFDKLEYGEAVLGIIHESLEGFIPDNELIKSLLIHTNAAVKRLKMNASISNPYKMQIKNKYIQAFSLSVTMAHMLEEKFDININEDETSYITLHIQAFFYRKKTAKRKVLVVCSSGYGTSKFLEQRIIREMKNSVEITRVLSLDELMSTVIEEDLIISTIPIKNSFIPVVQVSPLFTDVDLKEVTRYLGIKETSYYDRFYKLLDRNLFKVSNSKDDTHNSVIDYVGNQLIEKGYARSGIVESALTREELSSTAMNDFALPHTEIDYVNNSCIFIYINKNGVQWKGSKVKVVFFISLNEEVKDYIGDIYRFLNDLVDDQSVMSKLINVSDFDEIEGVIKEVKE